MRYNSTISTVLIERAQQPGDRAMDTILEDHIVVCGWNDDIFDVLETLMCSTDRNILIIAETPDRKSPTLGSCCWKETHRTKKR